MADSSGRAPLQTVDRALSILLSFTERRTDWGVTDLAKEFDLDKSAAQRLLSTLAARGFLHADSTTRRYRLGPALWRIASTWERRGGMASLVEPLLAELADASSRTAVFALADGSYVRCVAAVDGGTSPMRDHPLVGELYPAHAGATSRAYFAFLSAGQRQQLMYHRPLAKFSDLTALDAAEIEADMQKVADTGWAYSEGEYDLNTRALAAPVFVAGRPIGSISIGEHKREQLGDIRDHLDDLLRTAQQIGGLLSAHAPQRRTHA
ncbi:IclR family transcriptional regulator [Microbacterium esteraromaticum]|uniref:Glycerol operon regulatory protein n=1 Tax=Microbacterium esteraromaticum TaxID=57043 RepID=A0A7D8AH41_9MICO|nr:IclR family transcriptional regulator [Microbacterium esteraromaticum]QMU97522.1 IclR family transcriptional regulator [Microbacterium esteraromaticum]